MLLTGAGMAFGGTSNVSDRGGSGGETTVHVTGRSAFSFPAASLDDAGRTRFALGNSFFRRNWVQAPASSAARDGLGPHFSARSCSGCHVQDGRGAPPEGVRGRGHEQPGALLLRLSIPGQGAHGAPRSEPTYGDQLSTSAVQGVRAEGRIVVDYQERSGSFADGERYSLRIPRYRIVELGYGPLHLQTMIGPRIAPQLIGVGLLEAIPESAIYAYANEQAQRGDAIRGVPNRTWDVTAQQAALGRFGWKANVGSIAHQVASAFNGDIGITSRFFPDEACTALQLDCAAAPRGNRGTGPEIDDQTLSNVIFYQTLLAPPARRDADNPVVHEGEALFREAGCAVCHRDSWITGPPPHPEYSSEVLAGQTIHPYTDLLLHDMGDQLADGRPDFLASGRQWRTPPLWGVGLIREVNGHDYLLHDGRARGVLEAVLWHGGEAERSKQRVLRMTRAQRRALVRFVESL
jgi:CxxC motif-containing protein (DUF1111 family)